MGSALLFLGGVLLGALLSGLGAYTTALVVVNLARQEGCCASMRLLAALLRIDDWHEPLDEAPPREVGHA